VLDGGNRTRGGQSVIPAIDDITRILREGQLWYFRYPAVDAVADPGITAIVAVVLRTPSDPPNHCVEECVIEWKAAESGNAQPRLRSAGGSLKMLSLFPTVLLPFREMSRGHISPEAYIAELERLGVRNIRT